MHTDETLNICQHRDSTSRSSKPVLLLTEHMYPGMHSGNFQKHNAFWCKRDVAHLDVHPSDNHSLIELLEADLTCYKVALNSIWQGRDLDSVQELPLF